MVTDPIADFLTRIRNANMAKHKLLEVPSSKMKLEIARILFEKGYIANFKLEEGEKPTLKIALKYHPATKLPAIHSIVRVSKPGLRKYADTENLPHNADGSGRRWCRSGQYRWNPATHSAAFSCSRYRTPHRR